MKLRIIPVSDAEFAWIKQINPGFQRGVIKAGTYRDQGIEGEVASFQLPTILIASSTVPAEVIYKVTKAVVDGRADFVNVTRAMSRVTARDMAQSYGLPYHPGAMKYFKDSGLLK